MRKKIRLSFFLSFFFTVSFSQELFPHIEPASNIPKGVLGIRLSNEFYKEVDQLRSWQGYTFMFGLTSKFMLTQTFSFSNHHGKKLPADFIKNDGSIGLHTHGSQKGLNYPYAFENFSLALKYRFLSRDAEQEHFRMSGMLMLAGGNEAHDEAEPSLMGDNSGISTGITATYLKHKFAGSVSCSAIFPHRYVQQDSANIEIIYGKAFQYSLSTGYLFLPRTYKNYKQTNINVYAEFIGKIYDAATIKKNGMIIPIEDAPGLECGNYLEIRPSVQFIFHSNLRIDLSIAEPLISRSYAKTYPIFYFNLQRYFYFH